MELKKIAAYGAQVHKLSNPVCSENYLKTILFRFTHLESTSNLERCRIMCTCLEQAFTRGWKRSKVKPFWQNDCVLLSKYCSILINLKARRTNNLVAMPEVFFVINKFELTINLVTMTRFIKQQITSLTNQFSTVHFSFPDMKYTFLFSPLWSGKNKKS